MQQVTIALELRRQECFFWATHNGAELDLLVVRGRKRWGFEFKRTSQPLMTRSMGIALEDLALRKLYVTHAGPESFPISKKVSAAALQRIESDLVLD